MMGTSYCPDCKQYDVRWYPHNHPVPDFEPDEEGDVPSHPYCSNCDWGICGECEDVFNQPQEPDHG